VSGKPLLSAYPLTWPSGRPRTPPGQRRPSQFYARGFGKTRDELVRELTRLGAREVIVSSNVPTRGDGLPYANAAEPTDPGIAVYFKRNGRPFVIACDTYDKTWKNLRAISLTAEAFRAIDRHGAGDMLEQVFTGFSALPPARAAEPSWWETLGVGPDASRQEVLDAHRALVLKHHPDRGGNHDTVARINRARDVALEERA